MTKIQLKRGLEKDLPILSSGEPGFSTDTGKLFIGSPNGNVQILSNIAGVAAPNTQSWISSDNQDTFTISNGHISTDNSIIVFVGGIVQPNITLLNNTTFQLPESLSAGTNVYAIWFDVPSGNGSNQSEIDITLLKNYQEDVATPIANLAKGVSEYEWTAAAGQLSYVLPSGQTYDVNSKWLEVFVGGAPIPDSQLQKDSSSQFTLLIDSSKIKNGMIVFARWTQSYIPATSGHNITHQLGGTDEIDITKLKNFNEQVATPLAEKPTLDDSSTTTDKVWSSQKTLAQIQLIPKGDKGDPGSASLAIVDDAISTASALSSKQVTDIIYGNVSKVYGFTGQNTTYASGGTTRINGQQVLENLSVSKVSCYVNTSGSFKILELTKNSDGTFNLKQVLYSGNAVAGYNEFVINGIMSKGSYLGYYSATAAISFVSSGTGYSYTGEITGSNATVSTGALSFNFAVTATTLGIQNIDKSIPNGSIVDKMISSSSLLSFKKHTGLNLYDKNAITPNCYVSYSSGNLSAYNTTYSASDYIELIPGKRYIVSGTNQQMAFYDANKNYVSGCSSVNTLFNNVPVPAGVKYARFTCETANINSMLIYNVDDFNLGEYNKSYYTYTTGIVADAVKNYKNVTVKQDGTGDYTTITAANNACVGGSKNMVYNIYVYPGTYNEYSIALNDYVNLIGMNKDTCIIQGSLPDSTDANTISQTSTFDLANTNELRNLTITCKNMRYPIHDDGGLVDITRRIINCHVEHLGNDGARTTQNDNTIWTSECAFGAGTRSGNIGYFKDSTFKSNYIPFSVHNNVTFANPCYYELENCNLQLGLNPLSPYSARVQSDGSLTNDRIVFKGCRANYPVLLNDNWLGTANSDHIDWRVEGHSNDLPFASEYTTGQMDVTRFNDEVRTVKATAAIAIGQLCCWDTKMNQVRVMTSSDDISLFAGIAIEAVSAGTLVTLKYKGYMYKKWITSSYNSDLGTFFGVGADGKIAPTTKDKAVLVGMGLDTLVFKFI